MWLCVTTANALMRQTCQRISENLTIKSVDMVCVAYICVRVDSVRADSEILLTKLAELIALCYRIPDESVRYNQMSAI